MSESTASASAVNREDLADRLWDHAADVSKLAGSLPVRLLGQHVTTQLVRCGTAAAPSFEAYLAAANPAEQLHRLGIALQALRETRGWLRLIVRAELLPEAKVAESLDGVAQLDPMITRLISDTQGRLLEGVVPASAAPASSIAGLTGLDHIAIAVSDTEEALHVWRDRLGLKVLYSEEVNQGTVRLTHLDLGNAHLQLVEPLSPNHPLREWLALNGTGLHHLCLAVEDVGAAKSAAPVPSALTPHEGPRGKRALFLDRTATGDVQVELTGK